MQKYPKDEIDRRVKEAAEILGITDQLYKRPKQLSGGQRQRVALGRAIVRQPAVFLMDEPLSNLDAKLRVKMRVELRRIHERIGATTIYVTHDQVEAMTLADRIAVMNKGVLQQFAPPSECYSKPSNTFVATFIGSPAMNLISVTIMEKDGAMYGGVSEAIRELGLWGKDLTFGIRPEDIRILKEPKDGTFEARVYGAELLGDRVIAYFRMGDIEFTAQVSSEESIAINERVYIDFTSERVHLFGKDGRAYF